MATIWLARTATHELRKRYFIDDGIAAPPVFDPGYEFGYSSVEVDSLDDVHALLTRLSDDHQVAIVMGRPTIASGERNGDYFDDLPTDFWFIDLDGVPLVGSAENTIVRCLPFLDGKAFVYSYTQSAGIKDGLRVRVICKLYAPADTAMLKAATIHYNNLLRAYEGKAGNLLDSKIYGPAKLLLTSRPYIDGISDPHPDRVFMVEGDESPVRLDVPETIEIATTKTASLTELPRLQGTWGHGEGSSRSGDALIGAGRLMAFMGDKWDNEAERSALWHEMIRNAGGGPEDISTYGDFVIKRRDIRPATGTRIERAMPNVGKPIPLDDAQTRLNRLVWDFMRHGKGTLGLSVTMGVGKTRAVIKSLGEYLKRSRNAQDWWDWQPRKMDLYVPTISLADELLGRAQEEGITAYVERGRAQEYNGKPMCLKHEAAAEVSALGLPVSEHLCRNDDVQCAFYDTCQWRQQRQCEAQHDLRIRTHAYLPLNMKSDHPNAPPVFKPDIAAIDEDFLSTVVKHRVVEIGKLLEPRYNGEAGQWVSKFRDVLADGLTMERVEAAGFTVDICRMLIKAEEDLRPSVDITPDMSQEAVLAVTKDVSTEWMDYVYVWRRLRDCIKFRSMNRICQTKEHLFLNWMIKPGSIPWDREHDRPAIPILIMDGTMRRELVEQVFPFDAYHEIEVDPCAGAHIIQRPSKARSRNACMARPRRGLLMEKTIPSALPTPRPCALLSLSMPAKSPSSPTRSSKTSMAPRLTSVPLRALMHSAARALLSMVDHCLRPTRSRTWPAPSTRMALPFGASKASGIPSGMSRAVDTNRRS